MTENTEYEPSNDELWFVVITEADGPFRKGELIVCAKLPGAGCREIGGAGRKPLKWDCSYERYDDLWDAIEKADEIVPLGGTPISMKNLRDDLDRDKVIKEVRNK